MKKTIVVAIVSLVLITGLFAFDGNTSVSLAYDREKGNNYIGVSSETTGYFKSKIGYYGGVDLLFNLSDISDWNVGLIVGPSYRYAFGNSGVALNVALGVSAEVNSSEFAFGLGSNVYANWQLTSHLGFGVGAKVGNNFVVIPFDGSGVGIDSSFYIKPYVGAVIFY